ncbi:hypothetical protein E2C01_028454 [Portunus trituberculatus]|uniref:Uncharacterized protein n=1 Tax=Portunus trituberculatus TaxID=210409 RepID=A0A5B7ENP3_PORTR|nr:hypothetical protein [Portunus trituberculatus]
MDDGVKSHSEKADIWQIQEMEDVKFTLQSEMQAMQDEGQQYTDESTVSIKKEQKENWKEKCEDMTDLRQKLEALAQVVPIGRQELRTNKPSRKK